MSALQNSFESSSSSLSSSSSSTTTTTTPSPPNATNGHGNGFHSATAAAINNNNNNISTPRTTTTTTTSGHHAEPPLRNKMVVMSLKICTQMENVTDLALASDAEAIWVKVKCSRCKATSQSAMPIRATEVTPIMNGRSLTNMVYRCLACGRIGHIKQLDADGVYTINDSGEFRTFARFEVHGLVPVAWEFESSHFQCRSTCSRLKFNDVDFQEDRCWADYDEYARASVGIYDMHWRFVTEA